MTLHTLNQYGPDFQIKAISSLLTHKELLINIHDIISEEFFENSAHKWAVKEILRYYDKYHTTPSMDVLKVELQKVDNDVLQLSIKEQLKKAFISSDEDLKYVQEEFTNFCRNQQLKKALMSSVDLLKAGDFDGIRFMVDGALRAGQDKNVGHEYVKDIESRYRESSRTTIPTPWDKINDLLQGGLGNGDFGLIFGSPGGGKSWSLVAIGGEAVRLGYNVIHYTLELGEDYVGKRYDAFFTNIPVNKTELLRAKAEEIIPQLPGNLIIKEFPTGRATMSTIESHIKKVESMGVKADLIIIDYVDLLSSGRKNRERKDEIDDIYISTKGLARELDIPIWSVSQVNRAGAGDDIIEGDKAAGSYDKLMITDFCMSLSRKKEDKVKGTGRFHIMKNRYGTDGLTFGVKADTATGHFEVHNYNIDQEEEPSFSPSTKSNKFDTDTDKFDKERLRAKYDPGFFELSK
jgi:replicative DNA helicase|tara:strand:+ start:484 stop:1869 length:1386 start_codon:yes stop_codon:yes gene_type:complete